MKRLMIVNTYNQLNFCINLRDSLFKKDDVTLIISDHSRNAKEIASRLRRENFFKNVYYVETLGTGDHRTNYDKVKDFCDITFGTNNRYNYWVSQLNDQYFDELLVFNFTIETYGIFSILSRTNKKLRISRFEEGILSYNTTVIKTKRRELINRIRHMLGKATVDKALDSFYCFYPEVYKGFMNKIKVTPITKDEFASKVIKSIYGLEDNVLEYREKYIFFTSVYDFEGGEPIGEYDLVCRIASIVGKGNLLIKTHPRDIRTLYHDNGFNVDKNSSIPWEAIQLVGDFSDKVFLTVNSTSVLSGSTMAEKPVRTYYMFKLCDISCNPSCQKNAQDIEALLNNEDMRNVLKSVHIAERLEDIL